LADAPHFLSNCENGGWREHPTTRTGGVITDPRKDTSHSYYARQASAETLTPADAKNNSSKLAITGK